ncbi:MAG: zinc ribbon domain-containing protein [Rhodothermales bacterium]|nr:zinc ribbon domain-containing protein [Rhodothermales bacterium]
MPTYTYKREDGSVFEIEQRITADALETCPTTGQPVTRVITGGSGLVFKGSGFYLTDYARAGSSKGGDTGSGASKGEKKAESKSESKESKPASKDTSAKAKPSKD